MTKRGHFIINGIPRVIINQVIRQAGIYNQQITHKIIKSNKVQINRHFFVDLISKRGTWLRFEIDRRKKIWARMKKTPRIPILILLQSIGFNKKTINQTFLNINYSDTKINYLLKSLIDLNSSPKKNAKNLLNINDKSIYQKFLNPRSYDLGRLGRNQLNHKLGLSISENQTTLTPYDLLWSIDLLIKSFNNKKNFDDIDHLKNRRIRTSGELIQNQLNLGLIRLEKKIIEKLKKTKDSIKLDQLFTSQPFNGVFKEFFGSNPLSQFLDQANPLAELTHKRRLTSVGPGGINRDTAGMAIRGIHASHYGRICPIETPEGPNAGLVNSLTTFASLNKDGVIQTPFFSIYKGQIQTKLGVKVLTSRFEKQHSIILNNPHTSLLGFLSNLPLTAQRQQMFTKLNRNHINFVIVSCLQLISTATSLIPFLEHNDANRALMGSNMQRQAVPLMNSERPLIGTSLENKVLFFCGNFVQSKECGFVLYTSHKAIQIFSLRNYKIINGKNLNNKNNYLPCFKNTSNQINFFKYKNLKKSLLNLLLKKKFNREITFFFNKRFGLSRKNLSQPLKRIFKFNFYLSRARKLKYVKKNFLKNVIINIDLDKVLNFVFFLQKAYRLKYIDFNKHFLILLNNKSFYSNLKLQTKSNPLTNKKELNFRKQKKTIYFFEGSLSFKDQNIVKTQLAFKDYTRSNQGTCLIQKPIVQLNDWVEKGDLLTGNFSSDHRELALGKNVLIAYLSWEGYNFEDALLINEQLIFNDIYTSLHIEKYKIEARDTPFGIEEITKTIPELDSKYLTALDHRGVIKLGSWVKEGDILVGRVTPIRQRSLLPHEKLLYDIVGKKTSLINDTSLRTPKGVDGRIIDVQVMETKNIFQNKIRVSIKKVCIYILEYKKIKIGDKISGRHGNKGIVSKILNQEDMPYLPDGQPIDMILNPLGVPSRMNIGQIFESLLGFVGRKMHQKFKILPFDETFGYAASRSLTFAKLYKTRQKLHQNWLFSPNYPTKFRIVDGRTGNLFDNPVMVGVSYMMKLIHLVDEKIHARSTGPYSLVTQQPLRGRSKHGGQRFGEMEVWALEGFGVAYILQELLTVKSDDIKGRMQIMETILKNKTLNFGTPESFKVLIRELQALCLNIQIYNRSIQHYITFNY